MRASCIHDVQEVLVGREAESVRAQKVVGYDCCLSCFRVQTIDASWQLRFGDPAFIVEHYSVAGIGEPDAAVRMDHDVVGRAEPFAFETVHQDSDRAVVFGAGDAAAGVLAGYEPTLAIAGIAIAVTGGAAIDAYLLALLCPAQHSIVGNVAPNQTSGVSEPYRPFCPAATGEETFDDCVANPVPAEAVIKHLDSRVRVTNDSSAPIPFCQR